MFEQAVLLLIPAGILDIPSILPSRFIFSNVAAASQQAKWGPPAEEACHKKGSKIDTLSCGCVCLFCLHNPARAADTG